MTKPKASRLHAPSNSAIPPFSPVGSGIVPGADAGWSAMAKIVRDIDEEKIRDYKEDIDTILVFAGLFSAVMTAFLIESYQNLQQNPQDVMVALLQQLVVQTQSYSLHPGFLNSTSTLSLSSSAFEPSINAVRVNVLWFASLVLSLISASFGILVKQWLREYLAGEYTSPLARLRIRRFRNPSLSDWKVFEIAAVLPILLQLALALFFVGLCFFTADVHSSIGHTTIPLVAGWGFLFIAASLAPAFSPRCPYKTSILKTPHKWTRQQINKSISAICRMSSGTHADSPTEGQWAYKPLAYDEEHAAIDQKHDIDILISVDAIQSDERLLGVMWDALQQVQVDSIDALAFLFQIIGHRLERYIQPHTSSFLDLNILSKSAFTSIMDMAADLLQRELRRQSPTKIAKAIEWTPWMEDCLYLLFSSGNSASTPRTDAVLADCLSHRQHKFIYNLVKPRVNDPSPVFWTLQRLRTSCLQIEGALLLEVVQDLLQATICHRACPSTHSTLLDLLRSHSEMPSDRQQFIVDLLIGSFVHNLRLDTTFNDWYWVFIECGIEYSSIASPGNAVKLVQRMVLSSPLNNVYYRFAIGLENLAQGIKTLPHVEKDAQNLFVDAFVDSPTIEREEILARLRVKIIHQWRNGSEENETNLRRVVCIDPLKTCCMQLRFFQVMQDRDEVPEKYLKTYLPLFWETLYDSLQLVATRCYDGHPQLANTCLKLIDSLEPYHANANSDDMQVFAAWARSFEPKDSPFPDRLIKILLSFLAEDEPRFSVRARRIQHLEQLHSTSAETTSLPGARPREETQRKKSKKPMITQTSDKFPAAETGQMCGDMGRLVTEVQG